MLEAAIQALFRCGATGTLRKRIVMLIQEGALLCVVRRLPLPREALGSIGSYVAELDIGQLYTDVGHAVAACSLVEEADEFNEGGVCGGDGLYCAHTYGNDDEVELEYNYNLMARLFVKALRCIRSHACRYAQTAYWLGLHTRATTAKNMWTTIPNVFHTWGNVHGKPCLCGYSPMCRERFWDLSRTGRNNSFNVPNMRMNFIAMFERYENGYNFSVEDMRVLYNTLPRGFAHAIITSEKGLLTNHFDDIFQCPAFVVCIACYCARYSHKYMLS